MTVRDVLDRWGAWQTRARHAKDYGNSSHLNRESILTFSDTELQPEFVTKCRFRWGIAQHGMN